MRWWAIVGSLVVVLALGTAFFTWYWPGAVASPASAPRLEAGAPTVASPAGARGTSTQSSDGGGVTLKVTWSGVDAGPVFSVAMDTHSVDLDGYDLKELAILRTDDGREVRPSEWTAPRGGHHRGGVLAFPATTADGTPVIGESTKSLTIVVRDVAGVPERELRWEVAS